MQNNLNPDRNLDEISRVVDSERSIVNDIVVRKNNKFAIIFIREVFTVWKLVTSFLHGDAFSITVTSELISLEQSLVMSFDKILLYYLTNCHESIERVKIVSVTNILVDLPHLGSSTHGKY